MYIKYFFSSISVDIYVLFCQINGNFLPFISLRTFLFPLFHGLIFRLLVEANKIGETLNKFD